VRAPIVYGKQLARMAKDADSRSLELYNQAALRLNLVYVRRTHIALKFALQRR
jgi:hypothetical protein